MKSMNEYDDINPRNKSTGMNEYDDIDRHDKSTGMNEPLYFS